jgi:hypothetical protein
MKTSIQNDDHAKELILTIVKSLQPVTDDDIYLEYNEISEQELSFNEIKDKLKKMKKLEKIGETFVGYDAKEIWQVKEE